MADKNSPRSEIVLYQTEDGRTRIQFWATIRKFRITRFVVTNSTKQ